MKLKKLKKKIKGVFKLPKKSYYFGKLAYGAPYFFPKFIKKVELGWKEKFETPRFEWVPSFHIVFFNWQFCIHWNTPVGYNNDKYYEQILWYLYYADKDINKARDTWMWIDGKTKESTWNDKYLI